ncbi:MAG: alpha-glucosidase C-terminal domain-containing protein, partial [Candidatus Marinimicrobia bacterium]|nr:alpha-glucosidase C-terminal domain-containing protein [Candidatus Neomarinimicrobiota bacterium]
KYISVKNSQPKHIFSFARVDSNKSILIVVNMSSKNKIVSLDIREILNDRSNDSLKLLFGDTSFTLDNSKLKVEFLPFSYCLLEIQ